MKTVFIAELLLLLLHSISSLTSNNCFAVNTFQRLWSPTSVPLISSRAHLCTIGIYGCCIPGMVCLSLS